MENLNQYPWSSHQYYMYMYKKNEAWINTSKIQNILKNKLHTNYVDFIRANREQEQWIPAIKIDEKGNFLFNDSIMKAIQETTLPTEQAKVDPAVIITTICNYFHISEQLILSNTRLRNICEIRAITSYFLVTYSTMCLTEVARYFKRSISTLSIQIQKINSGKFHSYKMSDLQTIEILIKKKIYPPLT